MRCLPYNKPDKPSPHVCHSRSSQFSLNPIRTRFHPTLNYIIAHLGKNNNNMKGREFPAGVLQELTDDDGVISQNEWLSEWPIGSRCVFSARIVCLARIFSLHPGHFEWPAPIFDTASGYPLITKLHLSSTGLPPHHPEPRPEWNKRQVGWLVILPAPFPQKRGTCGR